MKHSPPHPTPARGRPRAFDKEEALGRALEVFWRQGYEGTSLSDLTAALGINRPSLYAAFGNKEELFRKAVERYSSGPAGYVGEALAAPTAREVAEALLLGTVKMLTDPEIPSGCFLVQAALCSSPEAACVRDALAESRNRGLAAIRERFVRAAAEGDLPAGVKPADLARFIATVMHGLSVQAAGGATRAELKRVAEMALRAW